MNNLTFLKAINAKIYKAINNKYYISIPFISYSNEDSYLENYNHRALILLTNDLLNNDDLEEFINVLDDRYDILLEDDIDITTDMILSDNYVYFTNLNNIAAIDIDEDSVKHTNQTFMNILKQTYTYNNLEVSDYVYKYVIDFYFNGQYDDSVLFFNFIFNVDINVIS